MNDHNYNDLPCGAVDFIDSVIKKVRYRKKVRLEVRDELVDHFTMALSDCNSPEEKETAVKGMIEEFGDVKTLSRLIRRGKKRCRPLWKKVIIRTFQGIGIFILCLILYAVWFFTGTPNPMVDYLEVWNKHVQLKIVDADNAWPHYEKAVSLYVKPDEKVNELVGSLINSDEARISDLPADEKEALLTWILENESAWTRYAAAADKPYCFKKYSLDDSAYEENRWLSVYILPHLSEIIGSLARIGVLRSKLAFERGDNFKALDNCVVLMKVSSHWQERSRTLVELLVGMNVGSYGVSQALRIVDEGELGIEELTEGLREMSGAFSKGYPHLDFSGERIYTLDVIQHCFTNGGPGGGHLIVKYFFDTDLIIYPDFEELFMMTGGSLVHAGRDKSIAKINEIYGRYAELSRMSPYERHAKGLIFDDGIPELHKYRYFVVYIMIPSLGRIIDARYEQKALYEATLTVLAVRRWEVEKGVLPEDLNVLVEAGYLDELPDDPYSDGPLIYRVDGDGFKLYSVGGNFTDDGGASGTGRNGEYKFWSENGDWVFWPVR